MQNALNVEYPPEKIFIDDEGIQVTYEAKLLQDIKQLMYKIDQRICNLEMKIDGLEKGSRIIRRITCVYK